MLRVDIGFVSWKVAGLLNCTSKVSCNGAIAAKAGHSKTAILNFLKDGGLSDKKFKW